MNTDRVVLTPADVPDGFVAMADVSGSVPADQLFPGAAHGARGVFIRDPWVLTSLVTHFGDPPAAEASVADYEQVFNSTPREIGPIPFLSALADHAAGGVTTGDPEDDLPGALAMMAWSVSSYRCDLSLSGLATDVSLSSFWSHEPATHLERLARMMATRAEAQAGGGAGSG